MNSNWNYKKRFRFWKTFWSFLAIYVGLTLIAFIVIFLSPAQFEKKFHFDQSFTIKYLISQCMGFVFFTLFFYFSLNAFYALIAQRRSFIHYIKPAVIAFLSIGIYDAAAYFYSVKTKIVVGMGVDTGNAGGLLPVSFLLFTYSIGALMFIGLSLLVAYLTYLRDDKKQRKILEAQKLQLEVEKRQANFNFLKAQINPHFLHNTLNFLYAKSLPYSAELSEGILTLSDIMRYALSEGNAKDGKAPLKDEIEHVRNVIKINQLRFSNHLNVKFSVEGVINGAAILPFILITLVENAFKHGDLKSREYPIDIYLFIKDNRLMFRCSNKKKSGPKELSTGIGLENIKKRLDLAYGKNYALLVKDDAEFYTTELTIDKL